MSNDVFQNLWDEYVENINDLFIKRSTNPELLPIPVLCEKEMRELLQLSSNLLRMEETVLSLSGQMQIVGDLHGHLFDLYRIFAKCGLPNKTRYLFLGDLVDRGSLSIETVTLVLLAKVLYPNNVYIIRGNHEFVQMGHQFGFENEIIERFGTNNIMEEFGTTFSYLPLAVLLNDEYLCIHGGLAPNLFSINQIRVIEKPFNDFDGIIPASILWSDPKDNVEGFAPSTRGVGFFFGASAAKDFLDGNGIKKIIRGHECVADGYLEQFGGSVITVFSASNYCGLSDNKSCVLGVSEKGGLNPQVFDPLPYLPRLSAIFKQLNPEIPTINSTPILGRTGKNIVRGFRRSSLDLFFPNIPPPSYNEARNKIPRGSPAKKIPQINKFL